MNSDRPIGNDVVQTIGWRTRDLDCTINTDGDYEITDSNGDRSIWTLDELLQIGLLAQQIRPIDAK